MSQYTEVVAPKAPMDWLAVGVASLAAALLTQPASAGPDGPLRGDSVQVEQQRVGAAAATPGPDAGVSARLGNLSTKNPEPRSQLRLVTGPALEDMLALPSQFQSLLWNERRVVIYQPWLLDEAMAFRQEWRGTGREPTNSREVKEAARFLDRFEQVIGSERLLTLYLTSDSDGFVVEIQAHRDLLTEYILPGA